jgi:hypothetical protein
MRGRPREEGRGRARKGAGGRGREMYSLVSFFRCMISVVLDDVAAVAAARRGLALEGQGQSS